ncbi:peptidoglycan editing factor PgeF [Oscillatoria sp. CS-180]|uniref:peptidoglycan editing factor PgeF n=1 Tax=Oscillatoria sp. CS-180 TaxID=3021720 RepID=UPI00232BC038|nr:peptidoglycan editing factor PgeF [Oscillatoria sp. CS-180]MDB9528341.1 peptidoglycan editing factor PgeF [Oscillatoria sp. CS-180]
MSNTWHWHTGEHPYLTTTLLKNWSHGFFTRASWPSSPESLSQQLDGEAAVYRTKQVHGKQVLDPSEFPLDWQTSGRPEADAVMTLAPQQAAWVCTADCTPILIADEETGQVAAIHAGWRGTALGIVPATVKRLHTQGSRLNNLRIAMGPAIAGEVYQVSTQVAAEVGRSLVLQAGDEDQLLTQLHAIEPSPLLPDEQAGRVRLDVRRVNVLQLLALGIAPDQIAVAPHCTYQEPKSFFSYRRSREKKVQWSGIVSSG